MKEKDYEVVTYDVASVFLPEGTYKISELEELCQQMRDYGAQLAKSMWETEDGKED